MGHAEPSMDGPHRDNEVNKIVSVMSLLLNENKGGRSCYSGNG